MQIFYTLNCTHADLSYWHTICILLLLWEFLLLCGINHDFCEQLGNIFDQLFQYIHLTRRRVLNYVWLSVAMLPEPHESNCLHVLLLHSPTGISCLNNQELLEKTVQGYKPCNTRPRDMWRICMDISISDNCIMTTDWKVGERRESWYGGRVDTHPVPLTPVDKLIQRCRLIISNYTISFHIQFGENWKKESMFFLKKTDFRPSKWNSNETIFL